MLSELFVSLGDAKSSGSADNDQDRGAALGAVSGSSAAIRSGASALEFALVAVPLILLLLAILQLGLVFFANYMLEHATAQGARLIRTGQAQDQGSMPRRSRTRSATHLTAPLSCAGLKLDVRRFTNFSSTELTNPLDAGGAMKTNFSYDPGIGGDVVVVRGFYEFDIPALLPVEISMSNMARRQPGPVVATAAFRNEPFQTTSTSNSEMRSMRPLQDWRQAWRRGRDCMRDRRGVSAIEFAMIAPMLILIYVGMAETGNVLTVYRRTSTVAVDRGRPDRTSQDSFDRRSAGHRRRLEQHPGALSDPTPLKIVFRASSPIRTITARWPGATRTRGSARAVNSPIRCRPGSPKPDSSVIVAEITYAFTPLLDLTEIFSPGAFDMKRTFYTRPRRSLTVAKTN